MRRSAFAPAVGLAALLVCNGCAAAQKPAVAAPAPASRAEPAAAAQPAYTGIAIRFAMSMTPGRATNASHPVIDAVLPSSPAQKAGLAPGDVILEVDGRDAREEGALRMRPGVRYALRIRRGDAEREVALLAVAHPGAASGARP